MAGGYGAGDSTHMSKDSFRPPSAGDAYTTSHAQTYHVQQDAYAYSHTHMSDNGVKLVVPEALHPQPQPHPVHPEVALQLDGQTPGFDGRSISRNDSSAQGWAVGSGGPSASFGLLPPSAPPSRNSGRAMPSRNSGRGNGVGQQHGGANAMPKPEDVLIQHCSLEMGDFAFGSDVEAAQLELSGARA